LSDKYSDHNDGTPGKNNNDSDDTWNNNLNTRQELFEMLEDKDKKIKVLELELNMTKTKNQQNKKKVQEDYQSTREEINFSDNIINFASHSSF
jgi:hypothetical protein